ncbi:hypothetical protein MUK42_05149 [Musa troglodytarum]|uniref:Protein LURP-one-related 15 n=1 Tax=Musa troglodytarum TaxID=320322 RepID=A0A9E7JFZ6_9LILI|nr:hypothetical protein MUK42_05149 [Musa troglodytarum]
MSSPSSQFAAASGAIVDPRFCVSYPIDLTFFNDAAWLNCDRLAVTDTDGNVVFKVEADKCSLRSRQVVVDASGKPVISMQQKLRSVHERWQVFKGDSSDAKHLLFSVRRSSALQFKTELDVFLAANTEEEACDFKTKGSYRKRSCAMSKEYKFANSSVSKDAFGVAINPNTDYCFIAALLIIQHELHKEGSETAGAIGESSGAIVAGIFEGLAAALVLLSSSVWLRSVHDRWLVFEGNSSDPKYLLFSVKRSSALQLKTELDVFLAANAEEEVCDFKMKGSFRKRSCTVYKGDSSTVVAQMSKEHKLVNALVSKDAFGVAVNPNADYAFITALAIIRHEFFKEDTVISDEISDEVSDLISEGISAISAALGGS